MKKTLKIPVVLLLITTIAAAGLISISNVEEVADAPIPGSGVEVYEYPAGYWEFYRLIYGYTNGIIDGVKT